jgi:hypothetical protein
MSRFLDAQYCLKCRFHAPSLDTCADGLLNRWNYRGGDEYPNQVNAVTGWHREVLDFSYCSVVLAIMNITDLTPHQLKRAAAIKEKLDSLNKELRSLLNGVMTNVAKSGKKRTMSAATRRKIAAAQRARWTKRR